MENDARNDQHRHSASFGLRVFVDVARGPARLRVASEEGIARSMTDPAGKLVICRTADVLDGEFATRVVVDNVAYAVYRLADRYYVSEDMCSHGPGSLGEGTIIGEEIECPFHQGRFHIPTGKPSYPPCTVPVRVWTVHMEGDQI